MTQITSEETDRTLSTIHERLHDAKRQIREEAAKGLVGRQITIRRDLKDPATGDRQKVEIAATVKGLSWTYDDDMLMVVTYTHPFTGELKETEEGM